VRNKTVLNIKESKEKLLSNIRSFSMMMMLQANRESEENRKN
jgi:hypothetical protein